jgi:phage-related minor tail protein
VDEEITISIDADTSGLDKALADLTAMSERFGSVLTGALKSAVVNGKGLEDVLRQIAGRIAGMALDVGLRPLQQLAGSFFQNLFGGILPFAKGGIVPFAQGGVVSRPTYFPAGRNLGLMGEAGPEAILPLARGPDGRLGVAAGGQGGAVNIVFNVTANDAESFRKSEAQVTSMLARAVSRGARRN